MRSADPVRGARGQRGWSPAAVGAAASRQHKTTTRRGGGVADGVQARRTEGAEQGGTANTRGAAGEIDEAGERLERLGI